MEELSMAVKLITNLGIIGVLIFAVYFLLKIVKYLSKELKEEIVRNDKKIVELYESRLVDKDKYLADLKEEYNSQFENCSKCPVSKS